MSSDTVNAPDSALHSSLPLIQPPSVSELFRGFFKVTITGFGGVLAWARREFVQVRRWMTAEEFNDLFAICQFLPGPNIVNFSIIYGWRLHGFAGAAAGFTALMVPPVILMIIAGELYARFGALPEFRGGLTGLAAAAAGLLISNAVQMAEPLWRKREIVPALVAAGALVGVGIMGWPLWWVIFALAPLSIALAWRVVR
jgi:chromate transporter